MQTNHEELSINLALQSYGEKCRKMRIEAKALVLITPIGEFFKIHLPSVRDGNITAPYRYSINIYLQVFRSVQGVTFMNIRLGDFRQKNIVVFMMAQPCDGRGNAAAAVNYRLSDICGFAIIL